MSILTDQEKKVSQGLGISETDFLVSKVTDMQLALQRENSMSVTEAKEEVMRIMGISPEEAKKIEAEVAKKAAAEAPLTDAEEEACRILGVTPGEYVMTRRASSGGLKNKPKLL